MPGSPDIDSAIDRLDAALRAAGLEPLDRTVDEAVLGEIAEAISPFSLPHDLAGFWRRVRVEQDEFPVSGWHMGSLSPPSHALDTYLLNLEPESGIVFGPPLLFPIARHSETQWSIELVSERAAGGVVISHLDDMQVEYPTFTALLEVYAELVEEGAYQAGVDRPALLPEDERRKQLRHLDAGALRDLYGASLRVTVDPSGWPAHWLASAGIDLASRTPLGATHTIAELVASAASGRVHGEVVRLAAVGGDRFVVVEDHSGTVEISCPADTSPWGPVHGRRYEFEVTIADPTPVATDIRPLDDSAVSALQAE